MRFSILRWWALLIFPILRWALIIFSLLMVVFFDFGFDFVIPNSFGVGVGVDADADADGNRTFPFLNGGNRNTPKHCTSSSTSSTFAVGELR